MADDVQVKDVTGSGLVVVTDDAKLRYSPGERLDFSGVRVTKDGTDVTSDCLFDPASDEVFPADKSELSVVVSYEGEVSSFVVKRKRSFLPFIIGAIICICIGVAIYFATRPPEVEPFPEGDTGAYLIPQGDMSDEDAQKLVDEMAEKSRITISLAPEMQLKSDGQLRVNLVVPEGNNGLSERLEIEQDGEIVYRSGVVAPGNRLEWGTDANKAHAGAATATVYAIKDAADFGNPVSVEVTIVNAS